RFACSQRSAVQPRRHPDADPEPLWRFASARPAGRTADRCASGLDAHPVRPPSSQADIDDVRQLAGRRVLVVGDLVLDEYITGRMTRISREAPVPIVEVFEKEDRAGSAASPAANV